MGATCACPTNTGRSAAAHGAGRQPVDGLAMGSAMHSGAAREPAAPEEADRPLPENTTIFCAPAATSSSCCSAAPSS